VGRDPAHPPRRGVGAALLHGWLLGLGCRDRASAGVPTAPETLEEGVRGGGRAGKIRKGEGLAAKSSPSVGMRASDGLLTLRPIPGRG
jgi:hypothetical protein